MRVGITLVCTDIYVDSAVGFRTGGKLKLRGHRMLEVLRLKIDASTRVE